MEIPADDAQKGKIRIDCLFGLGSLRHRAGDYETSAAAMEQVLSVHPTHFEARYYLGMAYRQLGRLEEAKKQLDLHAKMLNARRKALDASEKPADP